MGVATERSRDAVWTVGVSAEGSRDAVWMVGVAAVGCRDAVYRVNLGFLLKVVRGCWRMLSKEVTAESDGHLRGVYGQDC